MTSGLSSVGTAAPTPKCLLRSTAAAGAGACHASVLVLDLILMPNTFQRLSYAALKLCSTRSSQPHRAHPVPAALHKACRTCTHLHPHLRPHLHLLTHGAPLPHRTHPIGPARRTERTPKTRRTPDRIIQLPPTVSYIVAPVRQILILGSWVRAPGARTRTVRAPEPPYGNSQLLISKP